MPGNRPRARRRGYGANSGSHVAWLKDEIKDLVTISGVLFVQPAAGAPGLADREREEGERA